MNVLSYFVKAKKHLVRKQQHTTEKVCKEFLDLYEDEDFLEISKMNLAEVKAEISSYQKDPDEIVALIRGRLNKKITPIKNNKKVIEPINIMTFLSGLIDKKIITDAFIKPQKKKHILTLFSLQSPVIITSVIALFTIPLILSSYQYTNTEEINTALVQENQRLKNNIKQLIEKQKLELAAADSVRLQVVNYKENDASLIDIPPYSEDLFTTISMLDEDINNELLVTTNFKVTPESINTDTNLLSPPVLRMASLSSNNFSLELKEGDSFYYLAKTHRLRVRNWGELDALAFLQQGNKLIIKTDNNYVKKITYIKKDGSIKKYVFEGDTMITSDDTLYYDDVITIAGNINTSLSNSIKNNDKLSGNISIAHAITKKAELYLKTNSSVDFRKIKPDAPYKIEVKVRRNKEDNKIIYVDKVKVDIIDNYIVASNTPT